MKHSSYDNLDGIAERVAAGEHRDVIGGLWDQIGDHQIDFLIRQGLTADMSLLDIGCGSLRLGARAIAWLNAGRYFGTDISAALIEAGRERELTDALRLKAPDSQFSVSADFDFSFLPQTMDMAIAQSVFTHLPLNHLRRCLAMLAPCMTANGRFFVTYFECADAPLFQPCHQSPGGIVTHDFRDPYHYRPGDLAWAMDDADWRLESIGDWGHPRGQRMAVFHRLG